MKPLIIYNSGYNGVLFNSIELVQKLIDNIYIDKNQIYICFFNDLNYRNIDKMIEFLEKRYFWLPKIIYENDPIINNCNIITSLSEGGYKSLKDKKYKYNNLFIFQSCNTYNWLFEYLTDNVKNLIDLKEVFLLHNPKISVIKKNYEKMNNENFTKMLIKCFNDNKKIIFTHGVYPKYYNENLPKVNKYYMYLEGTRFFWYNKNFVIDPKENPYNQKDIEKILQWCKQNNIEVDVNIPCINPAFQYDGLIYYREFEYCSRLINEFLYYKKPVWIMKYNEGLDYYIPNAKELNYPFLLKRDHIEIDVENRFNEFIN